MSEAYALSKAASTVPTTGVRYTAAGFLALFMATLIIPVSFNLAGLRLSPVRILLLLSVIPLTVRLLSGKAGRLSRVDLFMAIFCLWMMLSLIIVQGMSRFAFSGISIVEIFGGYVVGRCLVRNSADFRLIWQLHLFTIVFLLPFVLLESLTGRQLWAEILDQVGDVSWRPGSSRPRMGLDRVITGFDHPILYGLYCSLGGAVGFYVFRDRFFSAVVRLAFITFMTFLSLSSGALLSVVFQAALMGWDWVSRHRWRLLVGLFIFIYAFLSIASNRGPIVLFIENFTFSPGNAWTRILQWEYGSAEVMRHPIFGMGLGGHWQRPSWLTNSIDNYWLVVAMRHGLPGIAFLALTIAFLIARTVKANNLLPLVARYRTGYMITLVGLCFTLATVHIWGAVSVFVMFYLGAGMWIADATEPEGGSPVEGLEVSSKQRAELGRDLEGEASPYRRELGRRPLRSSGQSQARASVGPDVPRARAGEGANDPAPRYRRTPLASHYRSR